MDGTSTELVRPIGLTPPRMTTARATATTAPVNSGLSYTFTSLGSSTDDIEFSNDSGASWIYTPVADADGYDANVTNIRINPKGVMRASNGSDHPTFTLRFQVRVQ